MFFKRRKTLKAPPVAEAYLLNELSATLAYTSLLVHRRKWQKAAEVSDEVLTKIQILLSLLRQRLPGTGWTDHYYPEEKL